MNRRDLLKWGAVAPAATIALRTAGTTEQTIPETPTLEPTQSGTAVLQEASTTDRRTIRVRLNAASRLRPGLVGRNLRALTARDFSPGCRVSAVVDFWKCRMFINKGELRILANLRSIQSIEF